MITLTVITLSGFHCAKALVAIIIKSLIPPPPLNSDVIYGRSISKWFQMFKFTYFQIIDLFVLFLISLNNGGDQSA